MSKLNTNEIPIVDFSRFESDFDSVSAEIKEIAATWGFLYLKNHGVDQGSIDKIFSIGDTFFNKTSQDEKDSCKWNSIYNTGYDNQVGTAAYFKEHGSLDRTRVDGKEIFSFRKQNSFDQPLPPTLDKVRPEIQSFIKSTHEKIAVRVLACLSVALNLGRDRLPNLHAYDKSSVSSLRLLHYSPSLVDDDSEATVRLGSHTDHGIITVLYQHQIMGLQVRPPQYTGPVQKDEIWLDAPVIPGTVLINIGETMTFLSGGMMKSTLHRVSQSPLIDERGKERYTIVYFCHPNEDTLLEVLDGIDGAIRREPPISCVTGQQVKTVKDWIEHRHSMGRLEVAAK